MRTNVQVKLKTALFLKTIKNNFSTATLLQKKKNIIANRTIIIHIQRLFQKSHKIAISLLEVTENKRPVINYQPLTCQGRLLTVELLNNNLLFTGGKGKRKTHSTAVSNHSSLLGIYKYILLYRRVRES